MACSARAETKSDTFALLKLEGLKFDGLKDSFPKALRAHVLRLLGPKTINININININIHINIDINIDKQI